MFIFALYINLYSSDWLNANLIWDHLGIVLHGLWQYFFLSWILAECDDTSYHNTKCYNWSKAQVVCWFGHFILKSCGNLATTQFPGRIVSLNKSWRSVTKHLLLSCSGMLRVGLLHWSPVCPALRELLCGHVRRLLGYFASAHSGHTGECGYRLGLRDWQVRTHHHQHIVSTFYQ